MKQHQMKLFQTNMQKLESSGDDLITSNIAYGLLMNPHEAETIMYRAKQHLLYPQLIGSLNQPLLLSKKKDRRRKHCGWPCRPPPPPTSDIHAPKVSFGTSSGQQAYAGTWRCVNKKDKQFRLSTSMHQQSSTPQHPAVRLAAILVAECVHHTEKRLRLLTKN